MTTTWVINSFSSLGAGVLASLSPCVYPMIPITLGILGAGKGKRIIGFALGQVIAFTVLGYLTVTFSESFGFTSESRTIRWFVALGLFFSAWIVYHGRLPQVFYQLKSAIHTRLQKIKIFPNRAPSIRNTGALSNVGAFAMGVSSALVASPCSSPILAGTLALIASAENRWLGMVAMAFYGLGFSLVFILVGIGLARINQFPRAGAWMSRLQKGSALAFVLGGFYLILI